MGSVPLTSGMRGNDVAQLQQLLSAIGLEVADSEREDRSFGTTTRAAVVRLQALAALELTGDADQATLEAASAVVERLNVSAEETGARTAPRAEADSKTGSMEEATANGEPLAAPADMDPSAGAPAPDNTAGMQGMHHEHPEPYSPLPLAEPRAVAALEFQLGEVPGVAEAIAAVQSFSELVGMARLCLDDADAEGALLAAVAEWSKPLASDGSELSRYDAPPVRAGDTNGSLSPSDDAGRQPPPAVDPPAWEAVFSRAPLVDLLVALTYATGGNADNIRDAAGGIIDRLLPIVTLIDAAESAISDVPPHGDVALRAARMNAALHVSCESPGDCSNPRHPPSRASAFLIDARQLVDDWVASNPISRLIAGRAVDAGANLTQAIGSVEPSAALPRDAITLRVADGLDFGSEQPPYTAVLAADGHTTFAVARWSPASVELTVPDGAPSGPVFVASSLDEPGYQAEMAKWGKSLREFAQTTLATLTHFPPRRPDPMDECGPDVQQRRGVTILSRPYIADAFIKDAKNGRLDSPQKLAAATPPLTLCWRVEQPNQSTTVEIVHYEATVASGLAASGRLILPPPFDSPAAAAELSVRIAAGSSAASTPARPGAYTTVGSISMPLRPTGGWRHLPLLPMQDLVSLSVPTSQDTRGAGRPAFALVSFRCPYRHRALTVEVEVDTDFLSAIGPDGPLSPTDDVIMVGVQAWAYDRDHPGQPCGTVTVTASDDVSAYSASIEVWVAPLGGKWELVGSGVPGDGRQAAGDHDFDGSNLDGRIPGDRTATVAIHNVLLDTGNQLFFSPDPANIGDQQLVQTELWDPVTLSTVARPDPPATGTRNIFCAGQALFADGRVLIAGGHAVWPSLGFRSTDWSLRIFDPHAATADAAWLRLEDMTEPRWYPTLVSLPDGRVLICSGSNAGPYAPSDIGGAIAATVGWGGDTPQSAFVPRFSGGTATSIDVVDPATNQITRFPDAHFLDCWADTYPHMTVLPAGPGYPRGAILAIERQNVYFFRYEPAGGSSPLGPPTHRRLAYNARRTFPRYGSGVLLPVDAAGTGRIRYLVVGGGDERSDVMCETAPATNTGEIVDFDPTLPLDEQPTPSLARTFRMANRRFLSDAVLLADGKVLIAGGAAQGVTNVNHIPVRESELFDPETETCRPMDTATVPRAYHSTHVLLDDGTVEATGSTGGYPPGPINNQHRVEIFRPPYLWAGPRPRITSSPGIASYGSEMTIATPDAARLTHAALIRRAAVTHANNMSQRYVVLPITGAEVSSPPRPSDHVVAAMPRDGTIAPSGPYMLVLVDSRGVPSHAVSVRLG